MKRAFLGLAFSFLCLAGCTPNQRCEKAIDNIIAKCGTCLPGTDAPATSSRESQSCKDALMNLCGPIGSSFSASSSSSSNNASAFLDCVANAASCELIMLCQ